MPVSTVSYYLHRTFRRSRFPAFHFRGDELKYVYSRYNFTWASERIVEIALGQWFLSKVQAAGARRVLEVGNVLAHYGNFTHDILDKYEEGPRVLNEDVATFTPNRRYDAIVSLSTLEHVGWDSYEEREPEKVLRAVENLVRILNPGGKMLVTMPFGYNSFVDQCVAEKKFPFTAMYFLKRVSKENEWREVPFEEVKGQPYNSPYFAANAIVVGVVEK
jgi:SAM-dependent methyltransferase